MLRAVLANGALLRLELVWACVTLVRWALAILVALYAYRAGGAGAVGVVAVARIAPAAVLGPQAGAQCRPEITSVRSRCYGTWLVPRP